MTIVHQWKYLSYIRKPESEKLFLPFELAPDLNFSFNAYHWDLPILGVTTTFSPVLTYAPLERLYFFGGVNFTQYHNLSYVQNIVARIGRRGRILFLKGFWVVHLS
jgi:hypothetical protein